MNALEIKNLTKRFPGFVLDDVSLTLPGGCVMGLVGENGAGKSTTIKLILGMLKKDGGSVRIFDQDHQENIKALKEDMGVVMDEAGIPEYLNAKEVGNIMRYAFRNWDDAEYERLLKKLTLPENKSFKDYSRGMRMKLAIAVAMSHHAKLLLLDEPTSGLDPVVRDEVVDLFRDFVADEEHSILISSHIVSDLEKLCDYIAFLHSGKLLLCEEKDRLLEEYCTIHCTPDQLKEIRNASAEAVIYSRESAYGAEAVIRREAVPAGMNMSPVSIEDLFVFMVKEAKVS